MALSAPSTTGGLSHFKRKSDEFGIDYSHFPGRAWSRGVKLGHARPISDYTEGGAYIGSDALRRRLIREGVKAGKCEECGLSEWMGGQIPLELDHLNSNHFDNSIGNLRVVCPNCHALLTSLRRRLSKLTDGASAVVANGRSGSICKCGVEISYKAKTCIKCRPTAPYKKTERIAWPGIEILIEAKRTRKVWALANSLGVSDSAIHKRIRLLTGWSPVRPSRSLTI